MFMPYNEKIAERIRKALMHLSNVKEKKMFGSLAFMVDDKMCINVGSDRIMCRIDPDLHNNATKRKGCNTVVMHGKEYKGFVYIDNEQLKNKSDLDYWIMLALEYNKIAKASRK